MNVEVYTKPDCPACKVTLAQLNRLGVPYETKDALEYADFLTRLGAQAAPVVIVYQQNGGPRVHWWAGHRPDHLNDLATQTLKRNNKQ